MWADVEPGLGLFLDMRWRRTDDLDLTIACDVEDVLAAGDRLEGWRAAGRGDHSFLARMVCASI